MFFFPTFLQLDLPLIVALEAAGVGSHRVPLTPSLWNRCGCKGETVQEIFICSSNKTISRGTELLKETTAGRVVWLLISLFGNGGERLGTARREQKNRDGPGALRLARNSFVLFHACLDEFPLLSAPVAFNYTLIHNPNWYASLSRWTMDFLQSIFLFLDQRFTMTKWHCGKSQMWIFLTLLFWPDVILQHYNNVLLDWKDSNVICF